MNVQLQGSSCDRAATEHPRTTPSQRRRAAELLGLCKRLMLVSLCTLAWSGTAAGAGDQPLYWQITDDHFTFSSTLRNREFATLEAACNAALQAKERYFRPKGYDYRSPGGVAVRENPITGATGGPYSWNNWGKMPGDPGFVDSERTFYCNHEYRKPSGGAWLTMWYYSGATVKLRGEVCLPGSAWNSFVKGCRPLPPPPQASCGMSAAGGSDGVGGAGSGGLPSPFTLSPIDLRTGNKFYTHVDIQGTAAFPAGFVRYFNSLSGRWSYRFGQHIALSHDKKLAVVYRPNGTPVLFGRQSDGSWQASHNVRTHLLGGLDDAGQPQEWIYQLEPGMTERFDATGRLLSVRNFRNGDYDLLHSGDQTIVSTPRGASIILTRDTKGRLASVQDPTGAIYRYQYERDTGLDLLLAVIYPDDTPDDASDNPRLNYHYENRYFPSSVTGMSDESGRRLATVAYDANGRATLSELGADRTEVQYDEDGSVTTTNALGKQATYRFNGIYLAEVEGHPSGGCAGANRAYTYTTSGFLQTRTDWNGVVTAFEYDETRGLETRRTEGYGTPQARNIDTEWHPLFTLPVRITEPDRITEFSYDDQGRLLSRSVRAVQ